MTDDSSRQDGHTPVTWYQLTHWEECASWKGFKAAPFTVAGACWVGWGGVGVVVVG